MKIRKMLYISVILNVLFLAILGIFAYRYNLPHRVAAKFGLIEKPKPQDYLAVISWNKTMESIQYDADVVFFGASLTSSGNWHKYFDSVKVCNLGKCGDNLQTMLLRVPQIIAVHPKKVFLAPEQNDMRLSTIDEFRDNLIILLDFIQKSNPQAIIYLESLLPLNERKFRTVCNNEKIQSANNVIKRIASDRNLTYINLYDEYLVDGELPMSLSYDGQHLKTEAYQRWAKLISKYLV